MAHTGKLTYISPIIRAKEKFWESVEQTSYCWNWTGYLDKSGLPVIRLGTQDGCGLKEFSARKLSLELHNSPLEAGKHAQPLICKNKLCVNPDHLVSGDEARFWANVHKFADDCWIWTGGHDKDRYGKFHLSKDGKDIHIRAHKYSWQLYTGRPVPPGILVCHTCDTPWCVNPDHLFLGTNNDNTQDKVMKGRQARGETNGSAKLKRSTSERDQRARFKYDSS